MTTKEKITETAFRLFLDKGYKHTSMSDLMAATKLSKGAFYHHFSSKEHLYHAVIDRYFLSYYQQISWDKIQVSNREEIEQAIKAFYLVFVPEILALSQKGMSRYFILFFEAYDAYPKFRKGVRNFYSELKDFITPILKDNKVQDAENEAIRLISKYEGLMFWLALFPEGDVSSLIADF